MRPAAPPGTKRGGRLSRAMFDLLERGSRTGELPWARLWAEGHGVHWGGAADYVAAHELRWRTAVSPARTG
jgi:hypothetical protein